MENKCQKALIMVTFFSVVISVTSAINPCRDRVENEICGQAGPMTKRCRKVMPDCDGVSCLLICVPETKGNPATIDWCSPNPCFHGTCGNDLGGYTCQCELGWSGDNCEVPDCSDGSPLFCNCLDDCPGAIYEAICNCSISGYSNEFVTIDASYMDGPNGPTFPTTTPEACKGVCASLPSCPGADFNTISNNCYINVYSPLEDPSNYITGQPTYQLFARKCLCT